MSIFSRFRGQAILALRLFGTDGAGALCRLCGDYDILSEGRCCYLLDDRAYLCHWNPFIFGGLYEMGEVGK